jgi:hypothetical protein
VNSSEGHAETIPLRKVADGKPDCAGGEDEEINIRFALADGSVVETDSCGYVLLVLPSNKTSFE